MAKFFYASNNGVIAVVREDHCALFGTAFKGLPENPKPEDYEKARQHALKLGARVFTFREKLPEREHFLTGSLQALYALIEMGGHDELERGGGNGWDGYVPFSNGHEFRQTDFGENERRYRTTADDILAVFLNK